MPKLEIIEVEKDKLPVCPHCDKVLPRIEVFSKWGIEQINVFICPHCNKILGVGSNFGW